MQATMKPPQPARRFLPSIAAVSIAGLTSTFIGLIGTAIIISLLEPRRTTEIAIFIFLMIGASIVSVIGVDHFKNKGTFPSRIYKKRKKE